MLQRLEACILLVELCFQPVDQFMIFFGVVFQFFNDRSLAGDFLALRQKQLQQILPAQPV